MECGDDELGRVGAVVGLAAKHARDRGAVLRIEGRVDFIEEVERCGVAALDGENERQSHECLLAAAQLLHHQVLARPERHLRSNELD